VSLKTMKCQTPALMGSGPSKEASESVEMNRAEW
jgi:hypothetical protein